MKMTILSKPYAYTEYKHGLIEVDGQEAEFNICTTYDNNVSGIIVVEDISFPHHIPRDFSFTEEALMEEIRRRYNHTYNGFEYEE
jgi:hypothetical protein